MSAVSFASATRDTFLGSEFRLREISGVFRLDDIDGALLQVAAALPVKLTRYGRYVAVFS